MMARFLWIAVGISCLSLTSTAQCFVDLFGPEKLKHFVASCPNVVLSRHSVGRIESPLAKAEAFALTASDPDKPEIKLRGFELQVEEGQRKQAFYADLENLAGFRSALVRSMEPRPVPGENGGMGYGGFDATLSWPRFRTGPELIIRGNARSAFRFPDQGPAQILGLIEAALAHFNQPPPQEVKR